MSDILMQQKASVERCIKQARDYYAMPSEKSFSDDLYKQDVVVINLQRACEQCIDLANHVIRLKKLGLPSDSAESFTLLRKANIISAELERKLIGMLGFRNIVVHQYRDIDYKKVETVVNKHADDLIEFAGILVAAAIAK
ncbi:type VII toxin-antitoxin system HepT family RNase toxin [Candidatus Spongiihabitans sp.]|uniref:type VII toxin-antitoxin system HepT family RNase toxin n=1 Tax=Candidatus Spongiihabitans sp. TaxID=3101308 RepID=UPI003C6F0836